VLLDLVDFATYGPIGLWAGLVVGGLAGYVLAASMGVAAQRRWPYALVAGIYCMLPFTAFLPIATVLGGLIRLRESRPAGLEHEPLESHPDAIEAEYEARWDSE
jgi:hypothetical protein